MSEIKALDELREALENIPDEFRAAVCRKLTHDVGVMVGTIEMVRAG